jgi:hypothetical protein
MRICDTCPLASCEGCPVVSNPEFYRNEERKDRWKVAAIVVVTFLVVLYVVAIGWFTVETHQVVSAHNAEITQTEKLATQIHALQLADSGRVSSTKADVAQINHDLAEAEALLNSNHSESIAYLTALCAATPGCVAPAP